MKNSHFITVFKFCNGIYKYTHLYYPVTNFVAHKCAIIAICNARNKDHTFLFLINYTLFTIFQIVNFQVGIYVYKALNTILSSNFSENLSRYKCVTRQKAHLSNNVFELKRKSVLQTLALE